jgi:hypothetical protein
VISVLPVCAQGNGTIRRISSGRSVSVSVIISKQSAGPDPPRPGRQVTTVLTSKPDACIEAFRRHINAWALCLAPAAKPPASQSLASPSTNARGGRADGDADAVHLFAGDGHRVLELDLSRGRLRSWDMPFTDAYVTGLAAVDDGDRVFVVARRIIAELDTRTGAMTTLVTVPRSSRDPAGRPLFDYGSGVAIDRAAGALLFADYNSHTILRVCGIRP